MPYRIALQALMGERYLKFTIHNSDMQKLVKCERKMNHLELPREF